MAVEMKQRGSKSWVSVEGARLAGAKLREALQARCRGERGLFITLTYNRDWHDWDAEETYHAASRERHVRRFMENLGAFLGENLKGRWICKMEFQADGFLHFHIILLGVTFIDHAAVTEIWGRGFVHLLKMRPKHVHYLCKYMAKGEDVPGYLYLQPIRSVKVIRTSPGFWNRPSVPKVESEPRMKFSIYTSIGDAIQRGERETIARCEGRYIRLREHVGTLLVKLANMGRRRIGSEGSWTVVHGVDLDDLTRLVPAAAGRAAATAGGAFHLKENQNPPENPYSLPWWVGELFRWRSADPVRLAA